MEFGGYQNYLGGSSDFTLDDIEKRVLDNYRANELTGKFQFYIQDVERQEFYKAEIIEEKLFISKGQQGMWSFFLNKLGLLMDEVDSRIQNYQASHTFFSKEIIKKAENGDVESLRQILYDFFNDELRRTILFDELEIPQPTKIVWYK